MPRDSSNPRVHVRRKVTALRTDVLDMLARWSVSRYVRVPAVDRPRGGPAQRRRQWWEFPENNAADWRALRREIRHMRDALDDLDALVDEQLDRFHCRQCETEIPASEVRAGYTACEHCGPDREAAAS